MSGIFSKDIPISFEYIAQHWDKHGIEIVYIKSVLPTTTDGFPLDPRTVVDSKGVSHLQKLFLVEVVFRDSTGKSYESGSRPIWIDIPVFIEKDLHEPKYHRY